MSRFADKTSMSVDALALRGDQLVARAANWLDVIEDVEARRLGDRSLAREQVADDLKVAPGTLERNSRAGR